MADSFNKKERDKKRKKRKQNKLEKKRQKKLDGVKSEEFMYVDEDGNLTTTPPDLTKKKKINVEDIEISTPKIEDREAQYEKEGKVKFFNSEKGFGFIEDVKTGIEYFVHSDNLVDTVKDRDKVIFEAGSGPKGPIALNVKLTK